jgi:hypothetical protein
MQAFCPLIGLYNLFRTKQSLRTLKSLTSTNGAQEQSLDGYSFMSNDIDVACLSYSQNWCPRDGAGVQN